VIVNETPPNAASTPTPPGYPRFLPQGDAALVVEFGDTIDRAVSEKVYRLADAVSAAAVPGLAEVVPTFRSLLVFYDPLILDFAQAAVKVRGLIGEGAGARRKIRRVHIPACYDEEFGPDLAEAARLAGLSRDDAVRLHASVDYHVYMLGFLPGFAYMGDVPEPLRLPRIQTPRVRVPARSLAIAFGQTGIYPLESPGGWRLIGMVPVELCDIGKSPPALLAPGDRVRFHPVDRAAFDRLRAEWVAGRGTVEIEEDVARANPRAQRENP
jgi:KipI family sensor histidine kinase inhibitor